MKKPRRPLSSYDQANNISITLQKKRPFSLLARGSASVGETPVNGSNKRQLTIHPGGGKGLRAEMAATTRDAMVQVSVQISNEVHQHLKRVDEMQSRSYQNRYGMPQHLVDVPSPHPDNRAHAFLNSLTLPSFVRQYHPDYVLARHRRISVDCEQRLLAYHQLFSEDNSMCCPDLSYSMSCVVTSPLSSSSSLGASPNSTLPPPSLNEALQSLHRVNPSPNGVSSNIASSPGTNSKSSSCSSDVTGCKENVTLSPDDSKSTIDIKKHDSNLDMKTNSFTNKNASVRDYDNNSSHDQERHHLLNDVKSEVRSDIPVEYLPYAIGTESRMSNDCSAARTVMRHLDRTRGLSEDKNPLTDKFLDALSSDAKRLNYMETYLWLVHAQDYYTGEKCLDHEGQLWGHCLLLRLGLRPRVNRIRKFTQEDELALSNIDARNESILENMYEVTPVTLAKHAEAQKKAAIYKWVSAVLVRRAKPRQQGVPGSSSGGGKPGFGCTLASQSEIFGSAHTVKLFLRNKFWPAYKDVLTAVGIQVMYDNYVADLHRRKPETREYDINSGGDRPRDSRRWSPRLS